MKKTKQNFQFAIQWVEKRFVIIEAADEQEAFEKFWDGKYRKRDVQTDKIWGECAERV